MYFCTVKKTYAMKNISKKVITAAVDEALQQVLIKLEILDPSKKTKKMADNLSRKFSTQIRSEVKKGLTKVKKTAASKSKGKKAKKVVVTA